MTFSQEFEDLLPFMFKEAETFLRQIRDDWQSTHQARLEGYLSLLEAQDTAWQEALSKQQGILPIWQQTEPYFNQLADWINELRFVDPCQTIRDDWWNSLILSMKDFPEEIVFQISPADIMPETGDSLIIRQWKRWQRVQQRIRNVKFAALNLFRKNKLPVPFASRKFSVKKFFRYYWGLPVDAWYRSSLGKILFLLSQQMRRIHQLNIEFQNSVLMLESATQSWSEHELDVSMFAWADLKPVYAELKEMPLLLQKAFAEACADLSAWSLEQSPGILHHWHYAGTGVLPARKYDTRSFTKDKKNNRKKWEETLALWDNHYLGIKRDWTHDLSLFRTQLKCGIQYFEASAEFERQIQQDLIPVFSRTISVLAQSVSRFEHLDDAGEYDLRKKLIKENRITMRALRKKEMPLMLDILVQCQLESILINYQKHVEDSVSGLAEKHLVFRKRDDSGIPPRSELDEIPIQALFLKEILPRLEDQLKQTQTFLRDSWGNMLYGVSEIDQMVEFNLETALGLLEKEQLSEEAHQAAMDGLGRVVAKIQQYVDEFQSIQDRAQKDLLETTVTCIGKIQELVDNEKLIALKVKLVGATARGKYFWVKNEIWIHAGKMSRTGWKWITQAFSVASRQYIRFQTITNLAPPKIDAKKNLLEFLISFQRKMDELPYIYKRMFAIEPLTDDRFFMARNEELQSLREDCEFWNSGVFVMTALVGESGSGRTTLLNIAEKKVFGDMSVQRLMFPVTISSEQELVMRFRVNFPEIDPASGMAGIHQFLEKLEKPMVLVVEKFNNLFLRTVEGLDLLENFLLLMSQTHRKVLWIVTSTLYTWSFLDKTLRISNHFSRVISLVALSRKDMENVILKRHRMTGYQLKFQIPEWMNEQRNLSKLKTDRQQQDYLLDYFFERLTEMAAGNIAIAIRFWLRAIQKIEEHTLILSPVVEFDDSFISQLSPNEIFTLGGMIQHEGLNTDNHARVFRLLPHQSELLMNQLSHKGLIVEKEGEFNVHPFLYRPVIRVLKRQNILH
ncbi:MAG: hypothetical protein HQM11_19185 [SAR324 cluster bacterium]|nr:hypothetical protein [SAR324 cluster bacterium]